MVFYPETIVSGFFFVRDWNSGKNQYIISSANHRATGVMEGQKITK
jgi:hypothetical protein